MSPVATIVLAGDENGTDQIPNETPPAERFDGWTWNWYQVVPFIAALLAIIEYLSGYISHLIRVIKNKLKKSGPVYISDQHRLNYLDTVDKRLFDLETGILKDQESIKLYDDMIRAEHNQDEILKYSDKIDQIKDRLKTKREEHLELTKHAQDLNLRG